MIEKIKKEIEKVSAFNGGHNKIYISDLFEILDKYNNKFNNDLKNCSNCNVYGGINGKPMVIVEKDSREDKQMKAKSLDRLKEFYKQR